jgi:serine/threonine-protein kinase
MDELEARRIPGTEEQLTNPFFSPDGQSVAYFAAGELKRVALSGGAPVVIAADVTNLLGASWGSDSTILFGQAAGIYRVSANSGTPELVIPAEEGELLYGPELMPDGDSVLFASRTSGTWDQAQIAVQSLSTGERTGLVSGGKDARYVPTGHLVYALGDGLFAAAFDTATHSVSGGAVSLVQGLASTSTTGAAHYGIADDGTLVYVNSVGVPTPSANWPVWVDHDGNEEPLGLEGCFCRSPSVSPDGTRVAFQEVNAEISQSDIWVWSLTQRTKTRLTFEAGLAVGPVWSPDSRRIAYTSLGEGLFVRLADGTGMRETLLTSAGVVWDWTADDELIFTDGGDIFVLSLAGDRERRPLLTTNFNESRPAVSPDGRWIAYESDQTRQLEVHVRPFPDVDAGRWQVSSGGGQEPDWSRDGQTLFYFGPTSLMEAAIGDGPAFTFATPKATLDHAGYVGPGVPPRVYAVSSDGERLLLWKIPADAPGGLRFRIVVVTNWVEELKRRVPTE